MLFLIVHYWDIYLISQNRQFLFFFYYLIINFQVLNHDALLLFFLNIQCLKLFVDKNYKLRFLINAFCLQCNQIILFLGHIPLLYIMNLLFLLHHINELYYYVSYFSIFLFLFRFLFYQLLELFSLFLKFLLRLSPLLIGAYLIPPHRMCPDLIFPLK